MGLNCLGGEAGGNRIINYVVNNLDIDVMRHVYIMNSIKANVFKGLDDS